FGVGERGVEAGQFLGAFAYAPFECLIRPFQRFGRFDAGSDVREGGHYSAIRHSVCADFDHDTLGETLQKPLLPPNKPFGLCAHELVTIARGSPGTLVVSVQDIRQPRSDTDQARWQIENFTELPVPADQLQILVEDGDSLPDVIECGLKDFTIVLNCGV